MSTAVLENYINGELVASSASETLDLISPVDESVVGRAPISNLADVVRDRNPPHHPHHPPQGLADHARRHRELLAQAGRLPVGSFDRNPALDVAPTPPRACHTPHPAEGVKP